VNDLDSIQTDLKQIKTSLATIENQLCSELYTVRTPKEAGELFARLVENVRLGHGLELIVRKV